MRASICTTRSLQLARGRCRRAASGSRLQGLHHLVDADALGLQPLGVELDLDLALCAADDGRPADAARRSAAA